MGRCVTLTRVDPTRRPQTWLSTRFSTPPAHPRVLFHLGSLDPSPNKTTRVVVVASALRFAVWPLLPWPQSAELIGHAPLLCSWPRAWEPSGDGLWAPELPAASQPLYAPLPCLSECQGSEIVAPHHPRKPPGLTERHENMWYLYYHPALPIYRSLEIPHPQHRLSHAGRKSLVLLRMMLRLNEVTRLTQSS